MYSLAFFSFAQNAANWWYFGANAGLDFSSGSPVAVTNGQLNVVEGCAAISDINGNLLFYTDRTTVYNSQNTAMSNGTGLMGCSLLSSTMGAIIVPAPTNTAQYYIFTTDCSENSMANGLRYSVVAMNLAGGLGDVVVASKNTLLQLAVCEKVTAVKNASQTGYWIITHEKNGNGFYAYQLTSTGLNMTPVISNIGVSVTANGALNVVAGYLKTSHQGNKIAIAHPYIPNSVDYGITEIFDFNNLTGNITNPISFVNGETNRAYGLEFSPNDRYLYVSCPYSGANTYISISPNPFSQTSTIEITPFIQNAQLVIYNLQGQKVRECTFFEQNFIFERGDLPNGMYFLQVSEKDKLISVSKIILGD